MREIVWLTLAIPEARSYPLASPNRAAHRWVAPSGEHARFLTKVTPKVPEGRLGIGLEGLSTAVNNAAVVAVHHRELHEPGSGWAPLAGDKSALSLLLERIPPEVVLVIFSRSPLDELWAKRHELRTLAPHRLGTVAYCAPVFAGPNDTRLVSIVEALADGRPPVQAMKTVRHELMRLHDVWPANEALTPITRQLIGFWGMNTYGLNTLEEGLGRVFRERPRPANTIRDMEEWARNQGWDGK